MRSTPSARRLASQAAARWLARPSAIPASLGPRQAALGRDDDARAIAVPAGERAGDQPLVVAGARVVQAVRVGGVEERDAGIERRVQDRDGRASSRSGSVDRRMHPMPITRPDASAGHTTWIVAEDLAEDSYQLSAISCHHIAS